MEGLGSFLNNLLMSKIPIDQYFSKKLDPYGIMNAGVRPPENVYGPMPMEQETRNMDMNITGGFEEEPKESEYPIQFGNLQIKPNASYSIGQTSYGIPGLKSQLLNSYFGGSYNYPFGESGLSFEGSYGKARGGEKRQYMDYPSESFISSSYPFNLGIRLKKDF